MGKILTILHSWYYCTTLPCYGIENFEEKKITVGPLRLGLYDIPALVFTGENGDSRPNNKHTGLMQRASWIKSLLRVVQEAMPRGVKWLPFQQCCRRGLGQLRSVVQTEETKSRDEWDWMIWLQLVSGREEKINQGINSSSFWCSAQTSPPSGLLCSLHMPMGLTFFSNLPPWAAFGPPPHSTPRHVLQTNAPSAALCPPSLPRRLSRV